MNLKKDVSKFSRQIQNLLLKEFEFKWINSDWKENIQLEKE